MCLETCNAGMGFMLTTIFPLSDPAGRHLSEVLYMGTFFLCSKLFNGISASKRAPSYEKEHPIKKATDSSGQYSVASATSLSSFPSR